MLLANDDVMRTTSFVGAIYPRRAVVPFLVVADDQIAQPVDGVRTPQAINDVQVRRCNRHIMTAARDMQELVLEDFDSLGEFSQGGLVLPIHFIVVVFEAFDPLGDARILLG